MDNSFILDGLRWSFSSVNSYNQCPKGFKLSYIDSASKVGNAFSDFGSLIHSLLERYFKHEIEFFELSGLYHKEYKDAVKGSFPPNKFVDLSVSYHKDGEQFCNCFEGELWDGFSECKVIGVEQKVKIEIDGRPFVGVIDLVVQDKEGNIIIVDHKSKAKFKNKAEKSDYLRQLYLYSLAVYEKYGKFPTKLVFHMFRKGKLEWEDFNKEKLDAAKRWFVDTINAIYTDSEFKAKPDPFFCNNLCGTRHHCCFSDDYDGEE